MADEPTQVEQGVTDATNEQPTGAEPGKQTETARTFTQAELDAIIKDRLAKAERKAQDAATKAAADAEAKALREQGEYKTLYEKKQAELEAAEQRARALEIAGIKRDVAARKNLPAGLVDRLRGETEEDIAADADALISQLPKPAAPNINAGTVGGGSKPTMLDGVDIDNLAARLGVSAKYAKEFLQNGGGR